MKRTIRSTLVVALLLALSAPLSAKDEPAPLGGGLKPVAVISLAGYDEIMSDVGFLGTISNNPGLDKQNLEGMLKIFTQGQGVNGLDRKRPWGAVVSTDGIQFEPLIFLPVEKLKTLLTSLAPVLGEARDNGDGTFQISPGGQKTYVKEQGGWAYLAQKSETLQNLPQDPAKLLGGLEKLYDVAIRVHVQNIPEAYRTFAIDQLKSGVDLKQDEGESDQDYATRKQVVETQVAALTSAVNDTDQITLGWQIDQATKSTFIEVQWTALAGTKMARQFANVGTTTSAFTGFLMPRTAIALNFASKVAAEDVQQTQLTLKGLRLQAHKKINADDDLPDEATKAAVREAVDGFIDALNATIAAGKVDAGATVSLEDNNPQLVVGVLVEKPETVETALKKLSQHADKIKNFPQIKFDAAKYADVRFHTMSFPVEDENAAKALGEKLDVAVGIGAKSVYVAAGKNSMTLLMKAIDASKAGASRQVLPIHVTVSVQSILNFAAAMNPDKPLVSALAVELAKTPDKDHVIITGKSIKDGIVYRYTAEEGVLKLFGHASKMAAGGAGVQGAR